jgi:hypothetical protein
VGGLGFGPAAWRRLSADFKFSTMTAGHLTGFGQ